MLSRILAYAAVVLLTFTTGCSWEKAPPHQPAAAAKKNNDRRPKSTAGLPAISYTYSYTGGLSGYIRCVFAPGSLTPSTQWYRGNTSSGPWGSAYLVGGNQVLSNTNSNGYRDYWLYFFSSGNSAPPVTCVRVYKDYTTVVSINYK
jgi:type II secretory pathway pseudopilin PulG